MAVQSDRTTDPKELSIVDILTVLVRYRRLIIWGTLAVTIIVAGVFFLLPALGLGDRAKVDRYDVSLEIRVVSPPSTVERFIDIDLAHTLQSVLTDPSFVQPHLDQVAALSGADTDSPLFAADFVAQSLSVTVDPVTNWLDVRCTCSDFEAGERLLVSMVEHLPVAFQGEIRKRLSPTISVIETSLASAQRLLVEAVESALVTAPELSGSSGEVSTNDSLFRQIESNAAYAVANVSDLVFVHQYLTELVTNPQVIYTKASAPQVVARQPQPQPLGRRAILAVSAVGAFFFFCFLAFLLDSGRRAIANPEKALKLKRAWNREPEE